MKNVEKKIRIALFIRGFHNGGIEKVFELYYSHMDLSPFEIHVITHMENDPIREKVFTDMGCIIHPLSKLRGHKLKKTNFDEYRKLFRENAFDIVHNNMPENLLPLLYAKKYGVKCRILHAHNIYTAGYEKKNPIIALLFKKGFILNASLASVLLGVSKDAANSAFGEKNAKEVVLFPNAIDVEQYCFTPEIREEYRSKLQLEDAFVLGHVGRYEGEQKNQKFILQVFSEFNKKIPNSRLLMIGDGQRLPEFKALASELKIRDKVIFTGVVYNVSDYMQAMDMFLFPSQKEGLGIAAIEAQATGLFCLISDKVPQEVKVTENVEFISIDSPYSIDKWVECIERQNIYKSYRRENSIEQVRQAGYDIDTQADKLRKVYVSVLDR